MTLNGVMAVNLRYFSEFGYIPAVLRKSSRSLCHILMSSCICMSHCCLDCHVRLLLNISFNFFQSNFLKPNVAATEASIP